MEMFYYLFYLFYTATTKLSPTSPSNKTRAIALMSYLEAFFFFSFSTYYAAWLEFKNENAGSPVLEIGLAGLCVIIINWLAFSRNDNWRAFVAKFSEWSKEKKVSANWWSFAIIMAVVINFIASCVLFEYYRPTT